MSPFLGIVIALQFILGLISAQIEMEYSKLTMCPQWPDPETEPDCTCYSQIFVESFSEYLYVPPAHRENPLQYIINETEHFKCTEFMKLPEYLEVTVPSNIPLPYQGDRRKKRRIKKMHKMVRRAKRQVSLGVPTDDKWEVIIPQLPQDGSHHYSPIGSSVSMKCVTSTGSTENGIQDIIFGENLNYDWKHDNGMEITAPYTNVDQKTGDLIFHRVRLEDTSIYNCTVTSGADFEVETKKASYLSQLDVIAGPTYWLRFAITFEAGRCQHKELVVIQQKVHDWVHQYVCHFCPVMNVSLTCTNFGGTRMGEDEKFVQLRLSISVLGFEERLTSWSHNHKNCNMECQKRIHAKVLSVTSRSLFKLFSIRIQALSMDGPTTVYVPVPNSRDEELVNACPPGFFLSYSLCFPCAPGSYSPTGPAECFPCVKGAFQPNPGSSACFNCPDGKTTRKPGAQTQADCILEAPAEFMDSMSEFFTGEYLLYTIIGGGVGGAVLFLWILVCWCWPQSRLGKVLTCAACCGEGEGDGGGGKIRQIPEDRRRLNYDSDFDSDRPRRGNPRPYRRAEFDDDDDDDYDIGYR